MAAGNGGAETAVGVSTVMIVALVPTVWINRSLGDLARRSNAALRGSVCAELPLVIVTTVYTYD